MKTHYELIYTAEQFTQAMAAGAVIQMAPSLDVPDMFWLPVPGDEKTLQSFLLLLKAKKCQMHLRTEKGVLTT